MSIQIGERQQNETGFSKVFPMKDETDHVELPGVGFEGETYLECFFSVHKLKIIGQWFSAR